ncbi:MAG: glycosyl-4,4'-diaponeurosporenoate acyltransferase [Deltaproteobacteria bacterium]|nr:MAG: glycosyl-4,4'-diaponeurosporenoate acyltransferase [Deltaproteobacteria bacterium]
MRLIYLPTFWTVFLDFAAWLVIHVGVVLAMVRVPIARFDPGAWIFRPRHWEKGGLFYVRRLRIKKWKKHLPDGARWLGSRGFPKTRLAEKGEEYLALFVRETCRAELTHWIIILFAPFFFLWNKPGVGLLMILYALAENLPLILAQRYNRSRLLGILDQKERGRGSRT